MENKEIPAWIVKYDQAGYRSGAGLAVRFLMDYVKELEKEIKRLNEEAKK